MTARILCAGGLFLASGCAIRSDLAPGVVYDVRQRDVSPAGALLVQFAAEDKDALGASLMLGGSAFGVLGGESSAESNLEIVGGLGIFIRPNFGDFYIALGWCVFPEPSADSSASADDGDDGHAIGHGPFAIIGIL